MTCPGPPRANGQSDPFSTSACMVRSVILDGIPIRFSMRGRSRAPAGADTACRYTRISTTILAGMHREMQSGYVTGFFVSADHGNDNDELINRVPATSSA